MSTRLVDRVSSLLEARTGRRGFLGRSALVGSAVMVAPVDYVLRPGTAYGAICNCSGSLCDCGDLCCDGYTEFCCTIYGDNSCPPGTIAAGWWKADGSPFCEIGGVPQPRYYSDCNSLCGGCAVDGSGFCEGNCSYGCGCGCAQGDCDNRKACCTKFRYGQCNQQVPNLGPIICRVITCIPPWAWEPTCTTVTATDNGTTFHDAPCLHQSDPPLVGGPVDADAAQTLVLIASEDDDMKLVERPDGSGTQYVMYPSGLLVEVTGNSLAFTDGGFEQVTGLSAGMFNRLVIVNEKVRALMSMNITQIPRV